MSRAYNKRKKMTKAHKGISRIQGKRSKLSKIGKQERNSLIDGIVNGTF